MKIVSEFNKKKSISQLASALPMHEAAVRREPKKDNSPESIDSGSNDSDPVPDVEGSADDENTGGEEIDDDQQQNQQNGQEYDKDDDHKDNIREMVHEAIRYHMGDHIDFECMSEETEQQLYDMFCEMEIYEPSR